MVRQGSVGYPAVCCCARPLRACVVCQPNWRGTEIPPSPGRGYIKSHPFHRRVALGLTGQRDDAGWRGQGPARACCGEGAPGEPGRRQAAASTEEATGRPTAGWEPQTESQPKAPARLHCRQCLRFCAAQQRTRGPGLGERDCEREGSEGTACGRAKIAGLTADDCLCCRAAATQGSRSWGRASVWSLVPEIRVLRDGSLRTGSSCKWAAHDGSRCKVWTGPWGRYQEGAARSNGRGKLGHLVWACETGNLRRHGTAPQHVAGSRCSLEGGRSPFG